MGIKISPVPKQHEITIEYCMENLLGRQTYQVTGRVHNEYLSLIPPKAVGGAISVEPPVPVNE